MGNKKKYHGYLKLLLVLSFLLVCVTFSTCFATDYTLNFTSSEIEQINTFYKINFSEERYQSAYLKLKNIYPTLSKLNIVFVFSSNGVLYMFPNNGSFSNDIDYLELYRVGLYFTCRFREDINSSYLAGSCIAIGSTYDTVTSVSTSGLRFSAASFSINGDIFTSSAVLTTYPTATFYFYNSSNALKTYFSSNYITLEETEEPTPTPDIETGTITNTSGETTGKVNLDGIEQGIGNINDSINNQGQAIIDNQNQNTQTIVNTISGETSKITNILTDDASDTIDSTNITSGDFANIVDFSPITNNQEYTAISNFWYELLNGFSSALTNINRILYIQFRGEQYEINLDNFSVFIPNVLKVFFGTLSTVFVVVYISKNTKHLIEDIQTASIDNVANKLTEDFESNMF